MIENIILDFGGILIDLDKSRFYSGLNALLGVSGLSDKHQLLMDEYEMGLMSEASFVYRLQESVDHQIAEYDILATWNSILADLPHHRLDFVLELRKRYQVYLLSNTNHSHIQWVRRDLKNRLEITDFEGRYFDSVFYSHEVNMRKPNHNIYQHVIDHLSLDPQKSIFIDDTLENVVAARAVGLYSEHHDPSLEISDQLMGYISKALA
ncbi:MAG: HAD family phosphatase [Bacteroidota bacterium]